MPQDKSLLLIVFYTIFLVLRRNYALVRHKVTIFVTSIFVGYLEPIYVPSIDSYDR